MPEESGNTLKKKRLAGNKSWGEEQRRNSGHFFLLFIGLTKVNMALITRK